MFQGFSEETIQFLWGIRFNNERPWFNDHKNDYLQHVQEPLKALAAEVQERMNALYPDAMFNVKVSRIYRDARRLYGKGPYKTHPWFAMRPPADADTAVPSFYFEISPEGYSYGMGYYCPKPALMEVFRRKVLREPEKLEKLARRLSRRKDIQLGGEEYKRPKGDVSPLLIPWFNRKWIELTCDHPYDDRYDKPQLVDDIVETFRFLMPYYDYFMELGLEPLLEG